MHFSLYFLASIVYFRIFCMCECSILEVPVLKITSPDVATKKYGYGAQDLKTMQWKMTSFTLWPFRFRFRGGRMFVLCTVVVANA